MIRPGPVLAGAAALALLLLAAPPEAAAQVKASPLGAVSQTIDGTTIAVEYSRPSARGRELFGGLVPYGYMWTPGANWATRLEVSDVIRLNGERVPAGEYSLWMQAQPDTWTVSLHPNPILYHTGEYPEPDDFQLSVEVAPEQGDHYAEMLTFSFPEVTADGGVLRMHWGETVVDLHVEVEPSLVVVPMTDAEMAPYVGTYAGAIAGPEGPIPTEVVVSAHGDHLRASLSAFGGATVKLMPTGREHTFHIGWMSGDRVTNVEDEPMYFELDGGSAARLVVLGIRNQTWIEAERTGG